MTWQTTGSPSDDPFAKAEADVHAMTSHSWWQTATPAQRAEQVTSTLLAGPGEWWLFGAWGRWYRSGLDGQWFPAPPPMDAGTRRTLAKAPPGIGNPPVPPQLIPTGADVNAGPMAGAGLLADGPSAELVAAIQRSFIAATAVNPEQFAQNDPAFAPGTPSTVAALWGAVLFAAGTPVVLSEHPLVAMFAHYLTVPADQLRWMVPPDLTRLATYYTDRLAARDPVGAGYLVRIMGEAAAILQTDPAFNPGAAALAAICAGTQQFAQADLQAVQYGPQHVTREWLRRCPAEFAAPIVREASPGEYLRLALYDLAHVIATLSDTPVHPSELRRAAAAVFAADLQTIPQAVPTVLPWLDPESARTIQEVLGQVGHPLRELFPQGVRLPARLSSSDPAKVRALLATTHSLAMTACRLGQVRPAHLEFVVPAACAAELGTPALQRPKATGELTAWEIIEAARQHLADERAATRPSAPEPEPVPAPTPPPPPVVPHDDDPFATRPGRASNPPQPPAPVPPQDDDATAHWSPAPAAAAPDPFGDNAPRQEPAQPWSASNTAAPAQPWGNQGTGAEPVQPWGSPNTPPPGQPWQPESQRPATEPVQPWAAQSPPPPEPWGAQNQPPPADPVQPRRPDGPPAEPVQPWGAQNAPAEPVQPWRPDNTQPPAEPWGAQNAPAEPVQPWRPDNAQPPGEPRGGQNAPAEPVQPWGAQNAPVEPVQPWRPDNAQPPAEPWGGQNVPAEPWRPDNAQPPAEPVQPWGAAQNGPAEPVQQRGAEEAAGGRPSGAKIVELYNIRFLCGVDDVERMVTEVRRRGKWARQLRGQEVSSASAPAVLLVGAASSGQRRLARIVARALAEVDFSAERVRTLHLEEIRDRGPEGLETLLGEHAGHTVLLEGLDELILDDGQGAGYARALYRVRAEGVTETTLVASCTPARYEALRTGHPELVTDFRTVRLPDLDDGDTRVALLALLADERFVGLTDDAWPVLRRDLAALQGRGRLINARLVEAYLDRACTRHLGQADATVAVLGERGFTLSADDLIGVADELPH